jgi:hypothetical protein
LCQDDSFHVFCHRCYSSEKQSQFQRLQEHLRQTNDLVIRENQVLREFRQELDMLVQERMSHIEELRLIHADINIVCVFVVYLLSYVLYVYIDGNNDKTS